MLTLPSGWLEAVKRGSFKPVTLFEISPDATTTFKFTKSSGKVLGYPNSVTGFVPVTHRIDPLTRKVGVGDITLSLADDGHFRRIQSNYRLKGKRVTVKLGAAGLAEANFAPLFKGQIEDVRPFEGGFDVEVTNALKLAIDKKITGSWVHRHPLQAILDIWNAAELPEELIDETTLDPDFDTEISHFNLSRKYHEGCIRQVVEPTSAFKLIDELAVTLFGGLVPTETGEFRFKRYDETEPVAATWSAAEIDKLVVKQTSVNIKNRVTVDFGWCAEKAPPVVEAEPDPANEQEEKSDFRYRYQCGDADSQSNHAWPGETERIYDHRIATPWLGQESRLDADLSAGVGPGGTFTLRGNWIASFSGLRGLDDSSAVFAGLTSSRTAFIKINDEIIEVEDAVPVDGWVVIDEVDPLDDSGKPTQLDVRGGTDGVGGVGGGGSHDGTGPVGDQIPELGGATFTIKTRGALGTAAADHLKDDRGIDFTQAIWLADGILGRFSDGVPILELTLPLYTYAVQVGDLVSFPSDVFGKFGIPVLTTSTKWEIVGKEIDPDADSPQIRYTVAEARTVPAFVKDCGTQIVPRSGPITNPNIPTGPTWKDGGVIITGSEPRQDPLGGALDLQILNGIAAGSNALNATQTISVALSASLEYFVGIDVMRNAKCYVEQPLGTGAPPVTKGIAPIAFVQTDGVGITTCEDLRNPGQVFTGGRDLVGRSLIPNGAFTSRNFESENRPPVFADLVGDTTYGPGNDVEALVQAPAVSAFEIRSGDAAMQFNTEGAGLRTPLVPVQSEQFYSVQFDWKIEAGSGGGTATADVVFWRDDATVDSVVNLFTNLAPLGSFAYQRERHIVRPPITAKWAQLVFRRGVGAGTTDYILLDRWHLERIDPSFHVWQNVSQNVSNGVFTHIFFGSGVAQNDHNDDIYSRFLLEHLARVPYAGRWQFGAQVVLLSQAPNQAGSCAMRLIVNGAVKKSAIVRTTGQNPPSIQATFPPITLAKQDTALIHFQHNLTGVRSTDAQERSTWFWGKLEA